MSKFTAVLFPGCVSLPGPAPRPCPHGMLRCVSALCGAVKATCCLPGVLAGKCSSDNLQEIGDCEQVESVVWDRAVICVL